MRIQLGRSALMVICAAAALFAVASARSTPSASALPLSTHDIASLVETAESATFSVSGATCRGEIHGTGFLAGGHLITNRHVVLGSSDVRIEVGNQSRLAPVTMRSDQLDLAATSLDLDRPALRLSQKDPEPGEPVVMLGRDVNGQIQAKTGRVHLYGPAATWTGGGDGKVMLIDVATSPGFSGGPVINRNGEVVAVLQGIEPTLELSIAIPSSEVSQELASGRHGIIRDCEATRSTS